MNKLNIDLDMLEPVVSTPKKKKLDIIEDLETLPEVADWQIEQFWEAEVEWIDKETIILHGRNEGRKYRVVFNKRKDPTTYIDNPIPLSFEWHRLTNFRHIEKVYKQNRALYNEWRGWLPYQVVMRVEGL